MRNKILTYILHNILIFLSCYRQGADGFGPGRGYGRGMAGRMGGRGFGNYISVYDLTYMLQICFNPLRYFVPRLGCSVNYYPNILFALSLNLQRLIVFV